MTGTGETRPAASGSVLDQTAFAQGRWGLLLPLALLLVLATCLRATYYRHYIWTDDVGSYIFQADIFALGRLKVPIPTPDHPDQRHSRDAPQFFRTWMVVPHTFNDLDTFGDKHRFMYSKYPPGHSLVLWLGKIVLRSYALVPLVLVVVGAVLLYLILRLTVSEGAARLGVLLLLLSPMYVGWGASLMAHNSSFCFLALGTLSYVLLDRASRPGRRVLWAFLTALFYGGALLCRPMTAVCFALPIAGRECWLVWQCRSNLLGRWLPMACAAVISVAALLAYNAHLTGRPLRFPFAEYWPRNMPRFTSLWPRDLSGWTRADFEKHKDEFHGLERVDGVLDVEQHTILHGLVNTGVRLFDLDGFCLVIPGALLLLFLLALRFARALPPYAWIYGLQVGLTMMAHMSVSYLTIRAWGPRYFYELLLPLFLLAAPVLVAAWPHWCAWPKTRRRVVFAAVLMLSFLHGIEVCGGTLKELARIDAIRDEVSRSIKAHVKTPAVVFLWPQKGDRGRYVGHYFGHLLNTPDFQGSILYAVNHGAQNRRLLKYYPGRHVYELYPQALYEMRPGGRFKAYPFSHRLQP